MKFNFGMIRRVLVFSGVFIPFLAGIACAEKSVWEKFKDFFSPGETIECEGPTCDEFHKLESKINTLEGRYSRERRPVHKRRYKHELDSLNVIRDSLLVVIKGPQLDSLKKDSAEAKVALASSSSATDVAASSAVVSSSSEATVSSAASSSSVSDSAAAPAKDMAETVACKPDSVYVRDTVVVHDTLYVVVTGKPAATPESPASSASTENQK